MGASALCARRHLKPQTLSTPALRRGKPPPTQVPSRRSTSTAAKLRTQGLTLQNQPLLQLNQLYQNWLAARLKASAGRASRRWWKPYVASASAPAGRWVQGEELMCRDLSRASTG